MNDVPIDYSELYDVLFRLDKRVRALEKDVLFIEKSISFLDTRESIGSNSLLSELNLLRQEFSVLKNNFANCGHIMSRLSDDLKHTIKKEDVVALNLHLDDIKFEEYVTKNDLIRGV